MNTWRATRNRDNDPPLKPLPTPISVPGGEVRIGQIWASLDSRDRRNNWRQERLVVSVQTHEGNVYHAQLYTLPGKPHQAASSCSVRDGLILRHRYVREATAEEAERACR